MSSHSTHRSLTDPRLRSDLARTVGRRIDPSDVEDVVQSTLTEALASPGLPRADDEIRRFVFAIARQKIVDWYRRRDGERRCPPTEVGSDPPVGPSLDLLRWAMGELPPQPGAQQTLDWMLREGEGETLADIAATLQGGMSIANEVGSEQIHPPSLDGDDLIESGVMKASCSVVVLAFVMGSVTVTSCSEPKGPSREETSAKAAADAALTVPSVTTSASASPANTACTSDADCRTWSSYCPEAPCVCRVLAKTAPEPKCSSPGNVSCFADPCMKKTAACQGGRCELVVGAAN